VYAVDRSKNFKNWIAHWEAVRDLAAKDGDYPKWEAAEREIKNYSEFCPIEIDRRPSETKVGAVLVEVS
jgi:hypothetical protein